MLEQNVKILNIATNNDLPFRTMICISHEGKLAEHLLMLLDHRNIDQYFSVEWMNHYTNIKTGLMKTQAIYWKGHYELGLFLR